VSAPRATPTGSLASHSYTRTHVQNCDFLSMSSGVVNLNMERLVLAHVSPIEKRADRYAHALSSRRSGRGSGATQGVAFCRAAGERNPQPEYLRKPTEDVEIL